jgi:hypothetical protein
MSKLKIIHNLDGLSKEQIDQYLRDISEHLGIDPDLNAFDVIRMDNRLQVYARRGTTDMLRESMDIDVTSIDLLDIPGSATFRATGRKGHAASNLSRQEIAIGSCAIAGLTGQKLSDAIMTAETRAGRRLTLKFTGLGILDVSEVPVPSASAASGAELAGSPVVMPPPTVRPAEAPGRDITPTPVDTQTQEQFEAQQAARRADAMAQLDARNLSKEGASANEAAPAIETPFESTPEQPTRRRRRRSANTVDISSPGQAAPVSPSAVIPESQQTTTSAPPVSTVPEVPSLAPLGSVTAPSVPAIQVAPATVPPPASITVDASPKATLTEEQKKVYFDRWKEYTQNVLPKAGMMGMDSVGGSTMQMRKFVQVNNGVNVNQLDAAGWDDLLSFLDNYSKQNGAPALVAYIQKAITTA